jgi:hypothetical protein
MIFALDFPVTARFVLGLKLQQLVAPPIVTQIAFGVAVIPQVVAPFPLRSGIARTMRYVVGSSCRTKRSSLALSQTEPAPMVT